MTKCPSVHGMTAFSLSVYTFFRQTQIQTQRQKMQRYKMTKCPSVHGMTALGLYLPLHSSDKHKYANAKNTNTKIHK